MRIGFDRRKARALHPRDSLVELMMAPTPDLSGTLKFELSSGTITLDAEQRVLLFPSELLAPLSATEAGLASLRSFGVSLGAAARSMGAASPEEAVTSLSAQLARAGFGRIGFERWGALLAVRFAGAPDTLTQEAQVAFLEGLMNGISERESALYYVEDRFLVLDPSVAAALRERGARGEFQRLSEVIAALVQRKDGRIS